MSMCWPCRGLADPNLSVQSRDAGIADPQVGLRATPDGQPRRLQRVSGAIDFEHKVTRTRARCRCSFGRAVRLDPGHRLRGNREPAGRELVVQLENDLDRAVEDVAEVMRVSPQLTGQFGSEGLAVRGKLVVVVLREADFELIGHEPLVARHEFRLAVQLALEPCGDLDRLDVALERACERAIDRALDLLLEPLENAHVPPPSGHPRC